MKIAIIVKGADHGPHEMANVVCPCDCVLKDAKDGDNVSFKGEGVLMEEDGKRYISVSKVDGEPVEEIEVENEPSDEEMGKAVDENRNMRADDALDDYMNEKE